MNTARAWRRRALPDPVELLSITERDRYLLWLRLGLAIAVTVIVLSSPHAGSAAGGRVMTVTAVYLAVSILSAAVVGRGGRAALPVMQGGLLIDGLYLASTVAITEGAPEALRLLPAVHVVAVTLLCSYRTGLKIAVWHTLLFLLVVEAVRADVLVPPSTTKGGLDDVTVLTLVTLWVFALGTAVFSAASERELRRQKHDLNQLAGMVARIEAAERTDEIPGILLDELSATFGFRRGVVVASPAGDLEVLASTGVDVPPLLLEGVDPLMSKAWAQRTAQLVRTIDPETDPRLAAMIPDARNVLVVPLLREGGRGLGVVAVERGGRHTAMRRWVVAMVGQFAEHAALALYSAWLSDERTEQLLRIQKLELQLRAQNEELEVKVSERTEALRNVIASLEEIDRQRRRLLEHVVKAAEEERHRIANDIHDDPVQKMVAVKMRLEMLRKVHPDLPEIEEAQAVMLATLKSMRTLLFDLSPPTLEEEGLSSALRYFFENSNAPFAWSVDDDGLDTKPSTQTSLILYRIAQEAVANARKHSEAEHLRVTLLERDGGVSMEIVDDGVGFKPQEAVVAAPGHLGLAAMRERAEMAGGWCSLWSLPGAGTTLEVWLPHEERAVPGAEDGGEAAVADVLRMPTDRIAGGARGADERLAHSDGRSP